MKLYAESLGAKLTDGNMMAEGWRAEVKFRTIPIGSLRLTETEMTFHGETEAIEDFLARFRAKALRNAG